MSESEVRARLERALRRPIPEADWRFLKRWWFEGSTHRLVREAEEDWAELRNSVHNYLLEIEQRDDDREREQAGELLLETEVIESVPKPMDATEIPATPLSDRTAARAAALAALDNYELGPTNPDRVRSRTIISRKRPQGGFDETLPQWVIELEIEAWVPADDVRNIYQHVQRDLLPEQACPKTQPRTYRVAQFVWEEKLRHGERLTWPTLFERWKVRNPGDEEFDDWRAFRTCFKRGEAATPPRYVHSNDHIAGAARRLQREKERWEEGGPWFGLGPSVSRQF